MTEQIESNIIQFLIEYSVFFVMLHLKFISTVVLEHIPSHISPYNDN